MTVINPFDETERYCICGIPISAISEEQLIELMKNCCNSENKIIINTPNLNFLRIANQNNNFRNALLNSDLLIPDGMSIIWLAKLLKIPITRRLAGSSLISKIVSKLSDFPFRVFYFGGDAGISRRAHRITNVLRGNSISVGYLDPGYGKVDTLSKAEYLQKINAAAPNILLVSLPAIKGVIWIERNIEKIKTNIAMSSGITVNFIAGKTKRAPNILQNLGLEWLWRIIVEPRLFNRYLLDGLWFFYILISKIFPLILFEKICSVWLKFCEKKEQEIQKQDNFINIILPTVCNYSTFHELSKEILHQRTLKIDASNVVSLDSRFMAELILLKSKYSKISLDLEILNPSLFFKIFLTLYIANEKL